MATSSFFSHLPEPVAVYATAQVAGAVAQLRESDELRFLLRLILRNARVLPQASVFVADPVQNAFDQGKQATALDLLSLISAFDPTFWPTLQFEDLQETARLKGMTDDA